jgi:hypothetical protein
LLETILGVVLHALELHLQLLVLILQLLERAGELAQRRLDAADAPRHIGGIVLRDLALSGLLALARLPRLVATIEKIVEEAGPLLLCRGGAGQQQQGKRCERRGANAMSWMCHHSQPGSVQCGQHRARCVEIVTGAIHALFQALKTPMPGARPGIAYFTYSATAYELAPSTVTARRFCDQQEMSSHSATGRSLP